MISSHSFAFCYCKYYIDRSPNYNCLSSVNLTALWVESTLPPRLCRIWFLPASNIFSNQFPSWPLLTTISPHCPTFYSPSSLSLSFLPIVIFVRNALSLAPHMSQSQTRDLCSSSDKLSLTSRSKDDSLSGSLLLINQFIFFHQLLKL